MKEFILYLSCSVVVSGDGGVYIFSIEISNSSDNLKVKISFVIVKILAPDFMEQEGKFKNPYFTSLLELSNIIPKLLLLYN